MVSEKTVEERLAGLPPGVMGVPTAFLGRYREFDACFNRVHLPDKTKKLHSLGCDVGYGFNNLAYQTINDPEMQWLWILGDDHDFRKDLWLNLYERDVDIVVPLCLRKSDNAPVLNCGEEGNFAPYPGRWDILKGKSGLMEWNGTVGNAGMLIRRRVLETVEPPWFRQGVLDPKYSSSDLYFSWEVQKYGFKIYIDLDNFIGHIEHLSVWPRRDEDGEWYVDFHHAGGLE